MPEGFSSIADLKVSVDANTEQLKGGLALAHNLVQRFASEGSTSLTRFDATVAKLGGGIDVLRGKFGVWLAAAEMIIGTLTRARAQGEQLAAMAGKTDEYTKMTAAIDEVTDAVKEGLNAAYEQLLDSLKSYALETAKGATGAKAATQATETATEAVEEHAEATGDLTQKTQVATASTGLHVAATKEVAPAAEAAAAATVKQAEANKALEASYSDNLIALLREFAHGFRRLADDSKWSVATVDNEMKRLEKSMNASAENVRRVFADGDSAYTSLFGGDDALRQIENIAEVLREVARLNEIRRAAAKAASEAERAAIEAASAEAFDKLLPGLEKEIAALERKAEMFGMTKAEAAAYAVVMRVVDDLTAKGAKLTEEHAEKLGDLTARMRELTQAEEDRAKAKGKADEAERFVQALEREVRELGRQQAQIGQSTAAVAGLNAEMKFRNQLEDNAIALSDKQRAAAERLLATIRQKAQAVSDEKKAAADSDAQTRQIDGAILAMQREAISLRAKTAALYDLSEAGQVNARIEKELQDLRAKGVPVDDKRLAQIKAEAAATIEAARAHEQARQQMAMLQESGRIVAGSLESAFARWTEGSKLNVRDMVRSMIADLAQLTFKKGVMEALFGGGGSSGGGMFGNLLGSMFGGARAAGGPVSSGRAYLVGEEGPELFMPGASGTIIPNGAIRGGAGGQAVSVHLHNTIDARGAYPESIAQIRAALAQQQAGLPGEVVRVVREAQERGIA